MMEKSDKLIARLDWLTIILYLVIMVCGWFSICGASADLENPQLFSFSTFSGKQLVWICCALGVGAALLAIPQRFYYSYSNLLYYGFLALLLLTIFVATSTKGSRSWLHLGPVSVQPAEFAKFATALALAKFVDRNDFNPRNLKHIIHAVALLLCPLFLIICQKETGSALVYLVFLVVLYREGMTGYVLLIAVCAVVFFVLGIKFSETPFAQSQPFDLGRWLVLTLIHTVTCGMVVAQDSTPTRGVALFVIGMAVVAVGLAISILVAPFNVTYLQLAVEGLLVCYLVWTSLKNMVMKYVWTAMLSVGFVCYLFSVSYVFHEILEPHQQTRINVILGLEDDPYGAGYNVNQSKIAIGSGGLVGKGFMKGTQTKLKYVPEQHTDFIFCTVGEEAGFVGSTGVLLLYMFLILRVIFLAERQISSFGRAYGYSVACILLLHLFINIGMVLGITPVIGIPLPFFSYGGSSLWGFTILLFILLRIDMERSARF